MICNILNYSKKYDTISKTNNNDTICKKNDNFNRIPVQGVQEMPNNEINRLDDKPFIARGIENNTDEGYVTFSLRESVNDTFSARYDIANQYDIPNVKPNDHFDGDFKIVLINDAKKAPENSKTYLRQPGPNKYLTPTCFIAKINEQLGEDKFVASIDKFPRKLHLILEKLIELKIGDLIEASGVLECKFK